MRTAAQLASFLLLTGCATENFTVNTYPEGARVTINGIFAGVTPFEYKVPRDKIRPLPYRVEKVGSFPAEGVAEPRVSAGRIAGTIFTAGILRAFRGWRVYDELLVELRPIPPPSTDVRPAAERLEEIEQIYERGLLSERQYKRLRAEILDELRGIDSGPAGPEAPIPFVEE